MEICAVVRVIVQSGMPLEPCVMMPRIWYEDLAALLAVSARNEMSVSKIAMRKTKKLLKMTKPFVAHPPKTK